MKTSVSLEEVRKDLVRAQIHLERLKRGPGGIRQPVLQCIRCAVDPGPPNQEVQPVVVQPAGLLENGHAQLCRHNQLVPLKEPLLVQRCWSAI